MLNKIFLLAYFIIIVLMSLSCGWGIGIGMQRRGEMKEYHDSLFGARKGWIYLAVVIIMAVSFGIILVRWY